ncbi:hypothetical protein Lalb_Chr13g0304221 [Lupinus albus]|uniref:DVL n=1 Tax=Lupinus albus TaxID=3870 RepID=A0A6A4PKK5_LUPAL|nr:hypothetical protein Lalb_Chr13g0304221 [Lupinus albus]
MNMDNSYSTTITPSTTSTQACQCEEASSSMKNKFLKAVKEQRSRLYILKRCIIMLLCWQE